MLEVFLFIFVLSFAYGSITGLMHLEKHQYFGWILMAFLFSAGVGITVAGTIPFLLLISKFNLDKYWFILIPLYFSTALSITCFLSKVALENEFFTKEILKEVMWVKIIVFIVSLIITSLLILITN